MGPLAEQQRPQPGLRERKKAKTRATIREHALRLIHQQGYAATTVEQIADAAEVSPSTFSRYFRTKENAVLHDPYDPLLVEAFRAQPADLSPMQAVRRAARQVLAAVPADELAGMRDLLPLFQRVPELRVRMLDELARSAQLTAGLIAERTGRHPDEPAVQTFAGAVVGAMTAVTTAAVTDPDADLLVLVDGALELLERGLTL